MAHSDDAMSTYDPYNTNIYKGHKLSSDVVNTYEVNTISDSTNPVSFKKRKARNMSNQKSAREEDD